MIFKEEYEVNGNTQSYEIAGKQYHYKANTFQILTYHPETVDVIASGTLFGTGWEYGLALRKVESYTVDLSITAMNEFNERLRKAYDGGVQSVLDYRSNSGVGGFSVSNSINLD